METRDTPPANMAQATKAAAIHDRRMLLSDGHAQVTPGAHPPPRTGFRVSKDSSDPPRAILSIATFDTTLARTAGVSFVTAALRQFGGCAPHCGLLP